MKKAVWIGLAGTALLTVLLAMLFAAYLVWELPQEVGQITLNGRVLDLHGAHAGHWLLVTLAVVVALLIAMVAVPAVLLLGFVTPIVFVALGLAMAAAILGLVLSPLLLLIWWLWKRSSKPTTMPG